MINMFIIEKRKVTEVSEQVLYGRRKVLGENHPDTKKIEDAISYSKDLKDRYTVLWLAYDLGVRIKI